MQTVGVYLVCCLVMVPLIRLLAADFVRNRLITGFLCFAALSVCWSSNISSTFIHTILLTVSVAFAFYLSRRFAPNDLMKLVLMVGTVAAVGSVVLIALFPQYGLQDRGGHFTGQWEGLFMQKNVCGFMLTLLLLPIFFVRLKGRYSLLARTLYSILILTIIVQTRSVGAWAVCLCCIVFSWGLPVLCRMRSKDRITVVALSAIGALAAACLASVYWKDIMFAVGKDPTMSERTIIWGVLLTSIMKHPLLGYGYMGFWQGLHGESGHVALATFWPGIAYAENGMIELCLGLGVVGVTLFLLIYARAVRDAVCCLGRRSTPAAMWYTSILFFVAVANIESGRIFFPSDLVSILLIVAFVGLRREVHPSRREAQGRESYRFEQYSEGKTS